MADDPKKRTATITEIASRMLADGRVRFPGDVFGGEHPWFVGVDQGIPSGTFEIKIEDDDWGWFYDHLRNSFFGSFPNVPDFGVRESSAARGEREAWADARERAAIARDEARGVRRVGVSRCRGGMGYNGKPVIDV